MAAPWVLHFHSEECRSTFLSTRGAPRRLHSQPQSSLAERPLTTTVATNREGVVSAADCVNNPPPTSREFPAAL